MPPHKSVLQLSDVKHLKCLTHQQFRSPNHPLLSSIEEAEQFIWGWDKTQILCDVLLCQQAGGNLPAFGVSDGGTKLSDGVLYTHCVVGEEAVKLGVGVVASSVNEGVERVIILCHSTKCFGTTHTMVVSI